MEMPESHRCVQCPILPPRSSVSMPWVLNQGQDVRVSSEPFHVTMQWCGTYIPTEAGIGNHQESENKEFRLCRMREQWICSEMSALQEPRTSSNHDWSTWTKGQHRQGKGSQEQQEFAGDEFLTELVGNSKLDSKWSIFFLCGFWFVEENLLTKPLNWEVSYKRLISFPSMPG